MPTTARSTQRIAPGTGLERAAKMTQKAFQRMSSFVYEQVGIKLPAGKQVMLEARLQKRLRALGHASYDQYAEFLFTPEGQRTELQHFIDVVTTNTTEFFRESKHFDHLAAQVIPQWIAKHGHSRPFRVWSAGCSAGMEPYTLAMVLSEAATRNPGFAFSILATDISSRVLEQAVRAIYEMERVNSIPEHYRRKYLLRSKDKNKRLIRMAPEIRACVHFERLNFMDDFKVGDPMDVIFCRNVIIYFDKPTQEGVFGRFCTCLRPGGHLFIGHSESLAGMRLPLETVAPTIYRRI